MTSQRLARLLRLKRLAEDAQARELQLRKEALDEAAAEVKQLDEQIASMRGPQEANHSAVDLLMLSQYREHVGRTKDARKATLPDLHREVEGARDELMDAWRERRAYDDALHRSQARERAERQMAESRQRDEDAMRKHGPSEET